MMLLAAYLANPPHIRPFRGAVSHLRRMHSNNTNMNAVRHANVLITWDVDGTLLCARGEGGNGAHKRAIEDAVHRIHNIRVSVNSVPHAGCTDRAIISDMCLHAGVNAARIASRMHEVIRVADSLIEHYVSDLRTIVLPGVRELLHKLTENRACIALTTGNLESCAWTKLQNAGLKNFFEKERGAFGSDCTVRTDILRKAIDRVVDGGNGFVLREEREGVLQNVFHVGDATSDMKAAREVGAKGIGVLTGAFSREQLEMERPYAILEDLSDTDRFLQLVGLTS